MRLQWYCCYCYLSHPLPLSNVECEKYWIILPPILKLNVDAAAAVLMWMMTLERQMQHVAPLDGGLRGHGHGDELSSSWSWPAECDSLTWALYFVVKKVEADLRVCATYGGEGWSLWMYGAGQYHRHRSSIFIMVKISASAVAGGAWWWLARVCGHEFWREAK